VLALDRWKYERGGAHVRAKLTDEIVIMIRRRYAEERIKQSELAADFGVTQPLISAVIRRKIWSHVE
jgi:predicted XRE-type DNA-binding protein